MTGAANAQRERIRDRRDQALELMLNRGSRRLREDEGEAALSAISTGVTAEFLAQLLGQDRLSVKRKLKQCPPLHRKAIGVFYDFRTAIQYLVKPKFDIEEHLQSLRVDELPIRLQSEFWVTKKRRTEWETEAGQLFSATDVQRHFGEVFLMVRSQMQLWVNMLEDKANLTAQQSVLVEKAIDALQEAVYQKVVEFSGPEMLSLLEKERRLEAEEREMEHPGYVEDEEGVSDDDTPFV